MKKSSHREGLEPSSQRHRAPTPRDERCVELYLAGATKSEAYAITHPQQRATRKPATLRSRAYEFFARPPIRTLVDEKNKRVTAIVETALAQLLAEYQRIAFTSTKTITTRDKLHALDRLAEHHGLFDRESNKGQVKFTLNVTLGPPPDQEPKLSPVITTSADPTDPAAS